MPDYSEFNTCPLLGRLHSEGPPATCEPWSDPPWTSAQVDVGWTSDRTRASSLNEVALSYKTSDVGIDDRDVSEGLVREVDLHRGSPHGPRSASPTVAPRR
jgi:hypothetical protein